MLISAFENNTVNSMRSDYPKTRSCDIRTQRAKEHKEKVLELYSALSKMGCDILQRKYDIYIKINGKRAIAVYVGEDSYKIYTNHTEWLQHTTYVGDLDEYGYTHYHVPTLESCVNEIKNFCSFMA